MLGDKAVVLLSGGQDSASCLLYAMQTFKEVSCISFFYNQRHDKELKSGKEICKLLNIEREVVDVSFLNELTTSELFNTSKGSVNDSSKLDPNLPASFVPGRNILFLTIAGIYAYSKEIYNLIGGMCQTDYSGYPDCRESTIKTIEVSLALGMDKPFKIYTPLMYLTKADSINLIKDHPKFKEVMQLTHTCYNNEYPPCGKCPACILREKGFKEAGVEDPLFKRS